jgi:chemotaxis response regulator CheB
MKKTKTVQPKGRKPAMAPKGDVPAPQEKKSRQSDTPFPIIGIGASAGGLEALEHFLGAVPAGSGMACVIVQHLDPDYKGMMPELLQRATTMKVIQVTDRTKVQPDRVYVITPNKDMFLLHGVLHLLEPRAPRGLRLPIDFFFSSLADDLKERSIGVILSGMGSDGTTSLRAIREVDGRLLYTIGNRQWDIPELRTLLETILPESTSFEDYKVTHVFLAIGRRVMLLNARQIASEGSNRELILLAFEDVTGTGRANKR